MPINATMTRWKAAGIHLALSASIALIAMMLMLFLWFAPPFFSAAGGQRVLLIMLGVDVTLGPLITLIIFNLAKSKRALRFDFSVIAVLQITALIYGLNVMFHARPVFVVFVKDSFDLVIASEINKQDLKLAKLPQFSSLPLTGPVYVYSELPENVQERNQVVFAAFEGKDLPVFPRYYQNYAGHENTISAAAKPLAELKNLNPNRVTEIDAALKSTGLQEADIGFVALRSKFEDMTVLINKHDGKVLDMLKMPPW